VVTRLAPGSLLTTHVGYDDGEHHADMLELLEAEIRAEGRSYFWVNAYDQRGFAGDQREFAAQWLKRNRPSLNGVGVLFKSRAMDMALSLLSMLSRQHGFIQFYSKIAEFEDAIAKVTPGFRRLPKLPPDVSVASSDKR
jgi:hypothetical protein